MTDSQTEARLDGMIVVTAVENDTMLSDNICPACEKGFRGGQRVFESRNQQVALHVPCVISLALVASLQGTTLGEIEANYQQSRAELITRLGLLDD